MGTINHTAYPTSQALTASNQNAPLSQLDQSIEDLRFSDLTIVTLASDVAATPTLSGKSGKGVYNLTIAAQTGATDDLIEVTGISVGDVVLLRADTGDTITVKHNSGSATIKIHCIGDADVVLDEQNPICFVYVETNVLAQMSALLVGRKIAILTDEKTTGTDGGGASATTWNARDLNTEQSDDDAIATIATNQFTPIAGDYLIRCYAPAYSVDDHRLRLYNVTGTAVVQEGMTISSTTSIGQSAFLEHKFTANGTDAYRIDHYTKAAKASNGLGQAASDGSPEIYLVIVLEKL